MLNLCACGCLKEVRKDYAPGHDMKHISELLKAGATPAEAAVYLSPALLARFEGYYFHRALGGRL